jgi:hypothetical protein
MPRTALNTLRIVLVCTALWAAAASAEQMIVTLLDGRQIQGEVTREGESFVIRTRFGTLSFPASEVASVEPVPDAPEDRYQQRLEEIDPENPRDHYELAQWAIEQDRLDLARKHLLRALELDEDFELARLRLEEVQRRIDQARQKQRQARQAEKPDARLEGLNLLSEEEINRIRIEEFRWDDPGDVVSVRFENDVIDRFIRQMAGVDRFKEPGYDRVFRSLPPIEQLRYILEMRPRDRQLKSDIRILSDPKFMQEFRSRVWPVVRSYCGQSQCHGGPDLVGGFAVLPLGRGNMHVDYTNFVLLTGVRIDGRWIVDRSNPERSLLLQFSLPPEQANREHPSRIRQAFTSRENAAYRRILEWIRRLSGPGDFDYALKFQPPFDLDLFPPPADFLDASASTQPAEPAEPTPFDEDEERGE